MDSPNRKIVVPSNFTIEVVIRLDPVNGQSEMQARNKGVVPVPINAFQVLTLLLEHANSLAKQIVTNSVKMEKSLINPNGSNNDAT
jgi:hypothetical protein